MTRDSEAATAMRHHCRDYRTTLPLRLTRTEMHAGPLATESEERRHKTVVDRLTRLRFQNRCRYAPETRFPNLTLVIFDRVSWPSGAA